jgi:hypothetical protein
VVIALSAATSGSQTVSAFTLSSKSCLQSDIIYSATITADATQTVSFISFDTATLIISWTAPVEGGVFTVSVKGSVTNAGASNAVTANFVLTVVSC